MEREFPLHLHHPVCDNLFAPQQPGQPGTPFLGRDNLMFSIMQMFSLCNTASVLFLERASESRAPESQSLDPGRLVVLVLATVKMPLQFYCNLGVKALASGARKSELRAGDATTGRHIGVWCQLSQCAQHGAKVEAQEGYQ